MRSSFAGAGAESKFSVGQGQLTHRGKDRRARRATEDRRDQRATEAHYLPAQREPEGRRAEEVSDVGAQAAVAARRRHRPVAIVAVVAILLIAGLLYLALGNSPALPPHQADSAHGLGQQHLEAMVARLAARLEKNPQDAKGWVMLARAQTVLGRFDRASSAYAKSLKIFPDDPQLLADYADALAMGSGGRLQGEPERLVERALRADPNNAKALALAGTIAFDNKDFELAIKHWEHLRDSIPPGSEFAKLIQASIDAARASANK